MVNKKWNKLISFCLTIIMVFTIISPYGVLASEGQGDGSGKITLSIDKLTINKDYVLSPTEVDFNDGESVWDVFQRVMDEHSIPYDYTYFDIYDSVYVESIDGDGEFDHGPGSGWMYNVNGWYPNYGVSQYKLKDGDRVEWRYTTNLGEDLGEDLSEWEDPPSEQNEVDKIALQSAIATAELNKASVKVSVDGTDIDPSEYWVTEAVMAAYVAEIVSAQALVADENAIQDAVDAKVLALNQATETFENAKQAGTKPVDKTVLQTAINEAELNKASVKVSVDGLDIDPSEYWVTEAVMNSYVAEIVSAQALIADENAIQDAVDAKVLALNQATTTFNSAKQIGTKLEEKITVKEQLTKNLAYLHETVDNPSFGTLGGEWSVLTLARGEYEVSDGYYETYYQNVVNEVKRLMPQSGSKPEGRLDRNKGTEHSRAILGLTSIGKDITDVGGYDLREALADFTYVTRQGINGPIFGLIAFDTHNYEIPVIEGVAEQTTREKMITFILDKEIKKGTEHAGGWALTGTNPDPDITAMAIQGLTPYYETNADVKAAVDRALAWLSSAQKEDGGYASWGTVNSESSAQVIVALTGLGIDPHTDSRFIKNGKSVVDALMSFAVPEGGFKHIHSGNVDGMATDQGTYALVAYDRFVNGKTSLYNMTDVTVTEETVEVDKIALQSAIESAELNKASVKVSVDGLDIDPSEYWVTEAVMNSYVAEIVSAQALVADENAIQDAVDAKVLALNQATTTFNNAKQIGTKSEKANTVKQQLTKNLAYLHETVDNPSFGTLGGEWSVLTLARGEYEVSDGYYETYYQNVVNEVKRLMPQSGSKPEGRLDRNKGTEHSRAILGLTSIGKDITDVGGYDLREALADFTYVTRQGINGPIFGLIAFDTHNYEIPVIEGVAEQTTREKMITFILDKEIGKGTANAGGWALTGTTPDPDITAMAIQGLTPYYETNPDVKAAVDRALVWLSSAQKEDGGYASWGSVNSESSAQVIVALTGLGIDPHTDSRFIKNGKSAVDALMSFAVPEGGFKHIASGKVDGMATDQGTYALVAYSRFLDGKTSLYNMTDVEIDAGKAPTEPSVIQVPEGDADYTIPADILDNKAKLEIQIPSNHQAKTFIELPVNTSLPEIVVNKGNISVEFAKGSMLTSSNAAPIELITTKNHHDETIKTKLYSIIDSNKEIAEIHSAFSMGGSEKVEFDQFVTITFSGMGGKEVAYISANQIYPIKKFASDQEGLASGKLEYAYDAGNDLIVKTKHFTDFIFYSKLSKETPDNGGVSPPGNGGGGVANKTITLSIDKFTINKGYVLPPTEVDFYDGESVWDVLQREMDNRGISYSYSYFDKYESIYVESIAGDGEFDHGSGSGWMYNVNGWYPNYGASRYILQDGDVVQWRYTTDLGADLGEDLSKWEDPKNNPTPEITIPVKQNEKNPVVDIPSNIKKDYVLDITKEHKDLDSITINIPNAAEKLSINLEEVKDYIPNIIVKKQNKVFVIDEGTKIRSGKLTIDIFAKAKEPNVATIVKDGLANENIDILDAFSMGSSEGRVFFDKPVTLTLKGMKGSKVGFIEKNKWHTIQMFNSEQEGAQATKNLEMQTYAYENGNDLIIKTNHFTTFVLYATKEVAFEQVPNEEKKAFYSDAKLISTWAYDLIHEATEKGFVEGYAGKINPKSNVTRAEFAKLMVSVLGLDIKTDKASDFADVKPGDWFYPYVNTAYSEKIVQGFNGKFLPNDNITREEMAVMIARALNLKHAGSTVSLKDNNKISSWAKSAVDTIVSSKLMEGYDNQFKPKDLATREMSIVVAMRAYHYHNKGTNEHTNKDIEKDITEDPKKQSNSRVKKVISETAAFMQKTITDPIVASVGGEWTVFGLARSGEKVPSSYFEKYYGTVEKTLKEKSGVLHTVKYTEYDRVILALTAIGKDIDDVAGYDLRKPLADFNKVIVQGINGPIFSLIALDSKNYDIPVVQGVEVQTTREMLVDFILSREIAGGGWALGQNPPEADPDITAMAIQGLTPYYETNEKVKQAVDRGINWLSKVQHNDGGYKSWGSLNSESVAQVIVALTGLGIDPHTDKRFVKNGNSALDSLLSFAAPEGGFYHVKAGQTGNGGAEPGEVDLMATDQAMYALVAYDRFVNEKKRLYDMTDVVN